MSVYLITGAARGLGLEITRELSTRSPDTIVYAGVRTLSPLSPGLEELVKSSGGRVRPALTNASAYEENVATIEAIRKEAGKLDGVFANAGIADHYGKASTDATEEMRRHFEVNAVGPQVLWRAAYPLLKETKGSKYLIMSTAAGSIGQMFPMENTAYGASKAAANFLSVKIHNETEQEGIVSFPVNPGWVQTDMGNAGAAANGLEKAPLTYKDTIPGLVDLFTKSTRETHGGKFWSFDGSIIPW